MRRPQNPSEALAFFAALSPSTVRLGLERVQAALAKLGHPDRAHPALQVAGTNGKGSTCAFAEACLRHGGRKVGLYTSPHLWRVNERIRVDGREIDDATFGRRILEVLEALPELLEDPPPLTYFEVGTVVALWHFAQERVEVAVLETGLGGRLDATTAARADATAITSLSLDHTQVLGSTLPQIAAEKAGILRPGVPAVFARQPPEAMAVLRQAALAVGAPVRVQGEHFEVEPHGQGLRYRSERRSLEGLSLGLRGEHQLQNAAVALAALEDLEGAGVTVAEAALREGLARARWPGRLEELPTRPPILLDGAHNEGGARALAQALITLYAGRRLHLVFGVLADKDHAAIRRILFPLAASVHLCPLASPRSLPPSTYAAEARAHCPDVRIYPDARAALAGAQTLAQDDDLIVGTGSLFLVGTLRGALVG